MRVAIIFDHKVRPDTTGVYCRRALGQLVEVDHFLPAELSRIPRRGYDLYLNVDDGLEYHLPDDLRPSAWWAIDTHLNYEYCRDRARGFDFVVTAQRDAAGRFRAEGITDACWLPLACDPEVHRRHDVPKEFDACFIGHLFDGPRADLVRLVQHHFPNTFVGQRYFEDMARTYSASRTVFNRSIRDDVNMRVFEALACGSLLVTNDLSENGQDQLARDAVHLATYRGPEELVDKLRFYRARDEVREAVAAAGRALALDCHTYRHRMAALLEHVTAGLGKRTVPVSPAPPPAETAVPDPVDAILSQIPTAAGRIEVVGTEARDVVARVRRWCPTARVIVCLRPEDFAATGPATDEPTDVIVAAGVLASVPDPRGWLGMARARLRPGGRLLATVVNTRHHRVVRSLLDGNWTYGPGGAAAAGHIFTRREVEKLFYRAGYAPAAITPLPTPGHADWVSAGRPEDLHDGPLNVNGLDPAAAEEFHTEEFLVCASPTTRASHGLTSIVVLTRNQLAYTRQCLDSLRAFTDGEVEVIVVDNGSTDGTVEYLRSLPEVRVIVNPDNRGFPAGCNQGIREARGSQVVLLNNDTVVTTGWLDRLLAPLAADPRVGLVGPSSNNVSGEQQVPVGYDDLAGLDGFAWELGNAQAGQWADTDRLVGFCLLIRREVIDRVGELDERFGVGCYEDDDYCRRALAAGFRAVHAKDAFVHHFGGRTFIGAGVDFAALMDHNRRLFDAKWAASSAGESPVPASARVGDRPAYACKVEAGGLRLVHKEIHLSLCVIARDNARTIRPCLESIRPYVDEMVVVDTGSADETPRLAADLGARVFHFPWCDDFSAARNESLRKARGKWVFWMDSDDTIPPACGRALRDLIASADPGTLAFTVDVHCPGSRDDPEAVTVVTHVKLFRNRPDLRFEHRIHEQILPAVVRAGGPPAVSVRPTEMFVVHSGYDLSPDGQARKLERDLRILHRELDELPDHPFTLFNLGMTYTDAGRHAEAIGYLDRCLEHSGETDSHVRKAFAYLVACHQTLGQAEPAWRACEEGLRRFPLDAELRFRRAGLQHLAGRLDGAIAGYRDLLARREPAHFRSVVNGIDGHLARHNLALVYEDAGDLARAEEQWRSVVGEKPGHRAGWRKLGHLLVRQHKVAEAANLAERLLGDDRLRPEGRLLRGRVAAARGDGAAARSDWDSVVADPVVALDALDEAARLLFDHCGPAAATAALGELTRRVPDDACGQHNLGAAHLAAGRPDRAVAAFRESLRLRPDWPPTLAGLADALDAASRGGEARRIREELKRSDAAGPGVERLGVRAGIAQATGHATAGPAGSVPSPNFGLSVVDNGTGKARFATRGEVDRAVVRDLWDRDVYGIRSVDAPPATVLDIGAHIGAFTLLASELWPAARIIACEPDPDNVRLLRENVNGRAGIEIIEAAVIGEDRSEVVFHRVPDKSRGNSGGGSCVRPEPGSVAAKLPAIPADHLWRSRHIGRCDLLKLDCEGAEVAILQRMAAAGLLADVGLIVGEWHAADDRAATVEGVRDGLRAILAATHELTFAEPVRGREGQFRAAPHHRRRSLTTIASAVKVALAMMEPENEPPNTTPLLLDV